MSYGYHRERSTDALVRLLAQPPDLPVVELPVLLTCRKALINAHRERCERATRGADVYSVMFQNRRYDRDLAGLARGGTVALRHLLDQYPTFEDHTICFTDVLRMESLSPYTRTWLEAARHALLASAAILDTEAWTHDPGQAWQVVADVADGAEALVALDRKWARAAGVGIDGARATLDIPGAELRLAARHIGAVARAGDLDTGVDGFAREEPVHGPAPLRSFPEIIQGARVTVRLLEGSDLSVRELRSFALIQSEIAHACAELVTDPQLAEVRESFLERDRHLRTLAGATARTASLGPSSGRAVLAQSQEVGHLILQARRTRWPVHAGVLLDFDREQSRIAPTLAANIGRDLACGRYLVVDDAQMCLRWRRIEPGEQTALQRAASCADPSLGRDDARVRAGRQRGEDRGSRAASSTGPRIRLRAALDQQPFGPRPHTPNRVPRSRL